MKHIIATGLLAAGLLVMPTSEANAQYYYGGYYGSYYSPVSTWSAYHWPGYSTYRYPGYSLSFSYSNRDWNRYNRYPRYNRYNRWDRYDRWDRHDRWDRRGRDWDRRRGRR